MSRTLVSLSLLILLLTPAVPHAAQVTTVMMVKGMMCGSCAANVKNALQKQPGVGEVSVDLKNDMVTVTYDNARVTTQQMADALKKGGYRASLSGR